jgi:DNA-binding MarR family transcriptional regulator
MSARHLNVFLDLQRAQATAARRFDAELGGVHGIGLADLHLLHALAEAPERRLRRGELARALGLTASGVTWTLRPLVKRRLVASAASSDDARVTYAVLTDAGRRLLADALPTARRFAAELLEPRLGKPELERLSATMGALAELDP